MSTRRGLAFVVMALSLATPVLTCGQTDATRGQRQAGSPLPSTRAQPILEVYNFALAGGAEGSEQARVLQQAVPDALYLRFLGNSRIEVRRVRQAYTSAGSHGADSRLAEGGLHYVLDGKIAFMQTGVGALSGHQSAPNFMIITYSLREVGLDTNSNPPIDRDETTTFALLPGALRRISNQVITTVLPPSKITLQVSAPQFKDLPVDRQAFYAENLPELLKTETSRQGWIDVVEGNGAADYVVEETLRAEKNKKGYELEAVISQGGVPVRPALVEPARETEVLAAQLRLASEIIDALKVSVALAPSLGSRAAQPSSDDYVKSAQVYEKTDPELSIALYKRAIERDPSNQQAKTSLAFVYIRKNQDDEALNILEAPEFEDSAYGQYLRSVAYNSADKQDAALKAVNRALELQPQQDVGYFWRGYLYENQRDYPKAVEDYETARKLNPSNPDYYEYSARVQEKQGNYDQAIAVLEAGRGQTSEEPRLAAELNETRRRASLHYLNANNAAESLRYALASVRDDENSEWGHRLVGIAYHRLGNLPEAERSLERALKIQETSLAYGELAGVRLDQGKKKDAFKLAEKAIEIDGNHTPPYGVLEKGVTGPEEAKEIIDWLKVYAGKNPPAHNALIDWDYFQLVYRPKDTGEVAELYSAYEAATKSTPYSDWLDGWANYVELNLIQGKYQEASSAAEGVLKATPKIEYQINLLFYRWVVELLEGNCDAAQNSLHEFTDYLGRSEVNGYQNGWTFKATRDYLDSLASRGALDPDSHALVESAMKLLESTPIDSVKAKAFLAKVAASKHPPCPTHAWLSKPHVAFPQ